MNDHFQFGGGAGQSSMHPLVLAFTLIAALAVLFLPRKYAAAAIVLPTFLTPFDAQLLIGGFHMFGIRMIIFAGLARVIASRSKFPMTSIEKTFFLWAFFRGITFILLFRETGAVVAQMAFWLDAYGGYLVLRYAIQDQEDVGRAIKALGVALAVLAACMSYEYATRINIFSYISSHAIVPWVRDGKVRAQGVFANSITAGTVGAVTFPLFFWLWKGKLSRAWGAVGIAASAVMVVTSAASTPFSALLAGMLALCLWPIRSHMRTVRSGIVLAVLGLALVMKAPVWFLLARIDFVGGHGWDRANLVDQCVRHVGDWWLLGTKDNASWGSDTWDACNQFVAEATGGGLISLALFISILSHAFGMIGKARIRVQGDSRQEWLFWALGSALFANLIAFLGIDYFDQTRVLWFAFLAMISAVVRLPEIEVATPEITAAVTGTGAGRGWFDEAAPPLLTRH